MLLKHVSNKSCRHDNILCEFHVKCGLYLPNTMQNNVHSTNIGVDLQY